MPSFDDTQKAALNADVFRPVCFVYLDIRGAPRRVVDAPYSLSIPAGWTGDADMDGQTFDAVDPTFISITPPAHKEGGGDSVTAVLSGLIGVDTDTLNLIGDKANFAGRAFRMWLCFMNVDTLQLIGRPKAWHTGYMMVPQITGDSTTQLISLRTENYLATLSQASGRTYLAQAEYDAGDLSANLAVSVANGTRATTPAVPIGATGLFSIFPGA